MDQRCLACHTEVEWMRAQKRGLHARVKEDCAKCHPDHAGRAFQLVSWDGGSPEKFDHARAGWPLEGKHAGLECRACHTPRFQRSPAARLIRVKDRARSWLGLEQDCASCHGDPHQGQLGQRCASCHGLQGWKPAPYFDHDKSRYPLTGRHVDLECGKCHLAPGLKLARSVKGTPIPLYRPLPHGECSSCHKDPHAGRFGAKCASCHTTDDFKRVSEKNFDHDRTRYPLRGRHATVACAACHDPKKAWGAKPAFASCNACHRDPHNGLGTLAGKPVDCAACHDVNAFKPSTFTVLQHRATPYPLEGRHAKVACEGCHARQAPAAAATLGPARTLMRPPHARCRDCHGEDHGRQLAARPDQGACESCHGVAGWKPSRFTVADHERLKLPLRGRHVQIACAACHGARREGLPPPAGAATAGKAAFVFSLSERECVACHNDPHRGRFEPGGARPRAQGCIACHGPGSFRPSTMDVAAHASSGFRLEGAHRATPCQACHPELKATPPASTLRLASAGARALPLADAPTTCEPCHRHPHGTQFAARRDKGACEACHGLDAWSPASRFDHNRAAAFRLDGAHAKVPCADCHKSEKAADGTRRVIYRPTPTRCESCHTEGTPALPGKTGWRPVPRTAHAPTLLAARSESFHDTLLH